MVDRLGASTAAESELQKRVNELQEKFYSAVKSSQRFSWMGVFEAYDQFQNPRIFVYLAERTRTTASASQNPSQGNILTPFRELSRSLRDRVFLGLYFLPAEGEERSNQLSKIAREDMRQRLKTESHEPQVKTLNRETFKVL